MSNITLHTDTIDAVLEQLGRAYIAQSEAIHLDHELRGDCMSRPNDLHHRMMHDTLREISRTILLLVDNVTDVPAIAEYLGIDAVYAHTNCD